MHLSDDMGSDECQHKSADSNKVVIGVIIIYKK